MDTRSQSLRERAKLFAVGEFVARDSELLLLESFDSRGDRYKCRVFTRATTEEGWTFFRSSNRSKELRRCELRFTSVRIPATRGEKYWLHRSNPFVVDLDDPDERWIVGFVPSSLTGEVFSMMPSMRDAVR